MAKPIPDADRTARELGATTVIGSKASLSRQYSQADAREILEVAGFGDGYGDMKIAAKQSPYGDHLIVIDETGVSPNNTLEQRSLLWKPCLELVDELDAPDAMVTPGLPFPFTAPQLAMFMLDGPGSFVAGVFGEWQSEPDQGVLDCMGIYANRAREAVRSAFAAYHQAVGVVGLLHRVQEAQEAEAHRLYDAAYGAACVKHDAFRDAVTREQYWILLERVNAEVASQFNQLELARSNSASARSLWRKAMVKELAQICLSGVAPDEPEEMPTAALPATTLGPAPVVAQSALGGVSWTLKKPQRFQGYGKPLYDLLKAAHIAGQPSPKARDVVDKWKENPPPDVATVTDNGLKYYDAKGNTKPADLEAIRKAIDRMIQKSPDYRTLMPVSARQS